MISNYFSGMLTFGFPGGSTGGCSSWGVGSGEGEVGSGSAALRAVLAECCSGEMLWSVPCEAWERRHSHKASSSGCLVAAAVKMRPVSHS